MLNATSKSLDSLSTTHKLNGQYKGQQQAASQDLYIMADQIADKHPNDNHKQIKLELDFELNNKSIAKFTYTTPSLDFLEHSKLLSSQLTLLKQILKSYPNTNSKLGQDFLTIFNKLTKPPQKRMKPELPREDLVSDHDFDPTLSNPQKSLYFYFRGELYRLIDKFEEAKYNLERSIKLNPRSLDSWYSMGKLLVSTNHLDQAKEAFQFMLDLDSSNCRACYRLGYVEQKLSNAAASIEMYKNSVRIDPKFSKGWFGLGLSLFELYHTTENLQDVRLAVSALNQAEKLGLKRAELNIARARCYQLLDKIDECILDYSMESSEKSIKRHCANLLKYKRELMKTTVFPVLTRLHCKKNKSC